MESLLNARVELYLSKGLSDVLIKLAPYLPSLITQKLIASLEL